MRLLLTVMLCTISVSLFGISVDSVQFFGGMIWVGNGERPDEDLGAPSPISQQVGVYLPLKAGPHFQIEPGIVFYGMNYGFNNGPRPRPIQIEHREMYVLNLFADLNLHFPIPLSSSLRLSPGISASGVFRIPTVSAPGEPDRTEEMLEYFLGAGRIFMPGAFVQLTWDFSEKYSATFRPGVRVPVFHLWDGESVPFYDQMIIYANVGISYSF